MGFVKPACGRHERALVVHLPRIVRSIGIEPCPFPRLRGSGFQQIVAAQDVGDG